MNKQKLNSTIFASAINFMQTGQIGEKHVTDTKKTISTILSEQNKFVGTKEIL